MATYLQSKASLPFILATCVPVPTGTYTLALVGYTSL